MSDMIIPCPSCQTLLLATVPACPRCGHAFEPRLPAPEKCHEPASAMGDEMICPACEEPVLKGLIRCWNCGNFLRS
jgi:rubredoxin